MDRKSKLAQPEHHKYKLSGDKFHGLSKIAVINKKPAGKFIGVKKCVK